MKKFKFTILAGIIVILLFIPSIKHKVTDMFTHKAKDVSQDVGKKVSDDVIEGITYAQYNNTNVIGSQIKLAEELVYKDGVVISVKTLKDIDFKKYTKENPYNVKAENDPRFIKTLGKFKSTLIKDGKDKVIQVSFEEIK